MYEKEWKCYTKIHHLDDNESATIFRKENISALIRSEYAEASRLYALHNPECRRADETEEAYRIRNPEWSLKHPESKEPENRPEIEQSDSVDSFINILDKQWQSWKRNEVKKA